MTSANAVNGDAGYHRVPQGGELRPWTPSGAGALVLDPRYSPGGKPFPVAKADDCRNATPQTRDSLTDPFGLFECYRLLHYQPYSFNGVGAFPLFQGEMRVIVTGRSPDHSTGVVRRNADLRIIEALYTVPLRLAVTGSHQEGGKRVVHFLHSLESSATADGRLFVAEKGLWSFNETPWNPESWLKMRPIEDRKGVSGLYRSVNDHATGSAAVPEHKTICRVPSPNFPAGGCLVAEEPFSRVYPVAAQPFYLTSGAPATGLHVGYTWISPEGTDIFARINPKSFDGVPPPNGLAALEGFESSTGMQFFSMGQHTNWTVRRIDGGVNIRRFDPDQLPPGCAIPGECGGTQDERAFSPIFLNTSSGFWAENRRDPKFSLPLLRQPSVFQFFTLNNALYPGDDPVNNKRPVRRRYEEQGLLPVTSSATSSYIQYWETSFACAVSPNCLLHLPMNEFAYNPSAAGALPTARPETHDASNNLDFVDGNGTPLPELHPYVGRLTGAARFIGDSYILPDERYLSGFRGTGIALGAGGSVSVAVPAVEATACVRSKGCLNGQTYGDGFTAEVAFLPLFTGSANVRIAQHHGVWHARLLANGSVGVDVTYLNSAGSTVTTTLTSPGSVPSSTRSATASSQAAAWTHIAVRFNPKAVVSSTAGLVPQVSLFVNGSSVANVTLPAGATLARGTANAGEILRVGPADLCTGCPAGDVMFVDELLIHQRPLRDEDIAASAGRLAARPAGFMTDPAQVRALLGSYFAASNPRGLTLASDGFPRFARPEELRIPVEFTSFASANLAPKFRQMVDLGAKLFSSPVLSTGANGQSQLQAGTGQPMSCATCHLPGRAFTDGRQTAVGVQSFPVNTPTIVNRAFGTSQFFERTSTSLVDLAMRPVVEPREMNGAITQILQRINSATDQAPLRQEFATVFGGTAFAATSVNVTQIALALTAFQLVQLSVDSLADAIISTNSSARDASGVLLTPSEVKLGKDLFEGKARCISCHVGTNFSDELLHDTGVGATAVKTPTLWNIGETAPYFQNGRSGLPDGSTVDPLRGVLEFYNRGGNGLVRSRSGLRSIDPELRPLGLTSIEMSALEKYLRALTNAGPMAGQLLDMTFSHNGPIPGLYCIQIAEIDTGWDDNYLCSGSDLGVRYSAAGTIAGMDCRQMTEPAEGSIWSDNVLCVPPGSPLEPEWSYTGPIANKACVNFNEPRDAAHAWSDNYYCYNPGMLAPDLVMALVPLMIGAN